MPEVHPLDAQPADEREILDLDERVSRVTPQDLQRYLLAAGYALETPADDAPGGWETWARGGDRAYVATRAERWPACLRVSLQGLALHLGRTATDLLDEIAARAAEAVAAGLAGEGSP